MSTFTIVPTYGANLTKAPRIRESVFGDGYEQRSADGINTIKRVWSLQFKGNTSEMDAVETFFETEAGVTSFDWTPPSGSAGKFKCSEWARSVNGYNDEIVTATFVEVFGE